MDIGIFSMNTEYTMPADELARECEIRGFESLWLPEHTHVPAVRGDPSPIHSPSMSSAVIAAPEGAVKEGDWLTEDFFHMSDPFIGLAAAAAVTKTLKLGTAICLAALHDPIIQAKQVASLDHISNGRFIFGVGTGWINEEIANHGVPPKRRWKVLTEKIEAMKEMWTQEEASYHGEFVNFDRIISYPKPLTKPHPPILLGCKKAPVALRCLVDLCDGWFPEAEMLPDMPTVTADLHERARAAGRDPGSIPISFCCVDAPDMERLERLRACGAVRTTVRAPTEGRDVILPFLDEYAEIAVKLA